jgi:hypothetical protein
MTLGVLVVALTASPAYSQSSSGARPVWDVPFDFIVGDETLPAGQYTIQRGVTPGAVLVYNLDGKDSHFRLSNPIYGNAADHSVLVFNRYGNQHFLSRVWIAGREDGSELKKSKLEREMARHGLASDALAMAAR